MARTTVPSRPSPKYRRQKRKGKKADFAFVELPGVRHYLGEYGTCASREKYHRLLAEWQAGGGQAPVPPDDITIVELCAHYLRHAEHHYRKPDGTPTTTLDHIKQAMRPLRSLYGPTLAANFGPKKLKAVRQAMVDKGWCRASVNKHVHTLRRIIKWAVAEEMLPPAAYQAVATVEGLRRGRTDARETEPVRPMPDAHIEAVLPLVSWQVAAMIQLPRMAGMRPGEVVRLRPCDIDRSGDVWTAELDDHKPAWRGKGRTIFIGPKGQAIIGEFLDRAPHKPLFSPAKAEAERRAKLTEQRTTPLSCGNVSGSNRRADRQPPAGRCTFGPTFTQAHLRRAQRGQKIPIHL